MNKTKRCGNPQCQAHDTGVCFESGDRCETCSKWNSDITITKNEKKKNNKASSVKWDGEAFTLDSLYTISQRATPIIIASIGNVDAGKTSYLGMLYTLLLNGYKLEDFQFSGSQTIVAWDRLADKLRFIKDSVALPVPTPNTPDYYHLLHLLLNKNSVLHEVIFADASGEVFKLWATNKDDENAESARWIHNNASAFLLFVDCDYLEQRKAIAKGEILDIAKRLADNLKNRPVAVMWSKADKIEKVHPKIKEAIKEELQDIFKGNYREFEITNYPDKTPEESCHNNNLMALNWLLNIATKASNVIPEVEVNRADDVFFNYK
ncbi:MAG: TRAFAC clade GTPase domain-containing protein [Dysgonomonas mossii]|uniref:TRAFAC clade GTPase domain-containing protein n=1 Tax=Dysgonomonas mossii TaxID=163665 RepID=UPI0039943C2C